MAEVLLPLAPPGLVIEHHHPISDRILLIAHTRDEAVACPQCGKPSAHLHSRYTRRLADLPWQGHRVQWQVRVRRLRCVNRTCPRRFFAEPLSGVSRPKGRGTERLHVAQGHLGLALGGEAGARLATQLAMPVSADTLLRRVRALSLEPAAVPTVLGVDDWAWRRGQRYGTVLVDLVRRRPLDLLPDRQAETLAAWLRRYPGIEVVARDRAGAYAEGIRQGAPQAVQVADRWHLLRNCSDALQQVFDRHHHALYSATQAVAGAQSALDVLSESTVHPTAMEQRSSERLAHRQARFEAMTRLRAEGHTYQQIADALGMPRVTVRRWLRRGRAPSWRKPPRPTLLDPYREALERQWQAGCRRAASLWEALRAQGFAGQVGVVRDWVTHRRRTERLSRPSQAPRPVAPCPTSRQAVRRVLSDERGLREEERQWVQALQETSPALQQAIDLARRFNALIKQRQAGALDAWVSAALESELRGFAEGIRRDLPAVRAALELPWSTGPVEGQINRLKLIKRQMYGRAGFDLLRQRVLCAA